MLSLCDKQAQSTCSRTFIKTVSRLLLKHPSIFVGSKKTDTDQPVIGTTKANKGHVLGHCIAALKKQRQHQHMQWFAATEHKTTALMTDTNHNANCIAHIDMSDNIHHDDSVCKEHPSCTRLQSLRTSAQCLCTRTEMFSSWRSFEK